jgi:GPH family glycoside/pentoside/hexuronide:cation symporter
MRTGHREEGLFFAGNLFMQKCVTGIGTFAAGTLVSAAGIPDNAAPGMIDPAVIERLILWFTVLTALFIAGAVLVFLRFPLGEADHEERLVRLRRNAPPATHK